jgi:hypothetical protein
MSTKHYTRLGYNSQIPSPPANRRNNLDLTCKYCHQSLSIEWDRGGSPGSSEVDYYDPGGSDWCPGAGPFETREEWKSQEFPTYLKPNPDFKPRQYHDPMTLAA